MAPPLWRQLAPRRPQCLLSGLQPLAWPPNPSLHGVCCPCPLQPVCSIRPPSGYKTQGSAWCPCSTQATSPPSPPCPRSGCTPDRRPSDPHPPGPAHASCPTPQDLPEGHMGELTHSSEQMTPFLGAHDLRPEKPSLRPSLSEVEGTRQKPWPHKRQPAGGVGVQAGRGKMGKCWSAGSPPWCWLWHPFRKSFCCL